MSTFTDSNGPQGCNQPSTKSLLELVAAYNNVLEQLNTHLNKEAEDSDVHQIRAYITGMLKNYVCTDELYIALSNKLGVDDAASTYATKSSVSDLENIVSGNTTAISTKLASDDAAEQYTSKQTFNNKVADITDALNTKADKTELPDISNLATKSAVESVDAKVEDINENLYKSDVYSDASGNKLLEVIDGLLKLGNEELSSILTAVRLYKNVNGTVSPYLTAADVSSTDKVGTIVQWPKFEYQTIGGEQIAVAVDFGDDGIYMACDGSSFDTSLYPELALILPDGVLPLMDYSIIKVKSAIAVAEVTPSKAGSLADAVATIHGTRVYTNVAQLPEDAADGTLAIVNYNNTYIVYKKVTSGWEAQ